MNKQIENIWNEYNQDVSRFLRSKSADLDLIDDIRSSVFEKLINNFGKIDDKSKIKSWLFRTAKNELIDSINKKSKQVNKIDDMPLLEDSSQSHNLSQCVVPLINRLEAKDRKALILSDIEGLDQKYLASTNNMSYSGLKSRVQRARKKLLSKFHDCCDITTNTNGQILDYNKKGNNSIEDCSLCSSN